MIIRRARTPGTGELRDLGIDGRGLVVPAHAAAGEELDADGRWLLPGLWDRHVHAGMWARARTRLDLRQTTSAAQVLDVVSSASPGPEPAEPAEPLVGFGFRRAGWPDTASVAALDAVVGERPVVLIAGDAHSAWLSSAAARRLGAVAGDGLVEEGDWFAVAGDLDHALGLSEVSDAEIAAAMREAAALGVVGIVDFEFDSAWQVWPGRVARGIDLVRVQAACYADTLDAVLAAGHRTGAVLDGSGLVTMGPLKCISDGSLGTLTAHCRDPYPSGGHGAQNIGPTELSALLTRARRHGLTAAVHAIGDAALGIALDAFETSGAQGSIEHAQLARPGDIARLATLGLEASVQPAHLLDDRPLVAHTWPGRDRDCFPLRSMLEAGVSLALGSDAPVAVLDPWLAIDAAVARSTPGDDPWVPQQCLTRAEALAASTNGNRLRPGEPGDVVLLEEDPWEVSRPRVARTVVGGRTTWCQH